MSRQRAFSTSFSRSTCSLALTLLVLYQSRVNYSQSVMYVCMVTSGICAHVRETESGVFTTCTFSIQPSEAALSSFACIYTVSWCYREETNLVQLHIAGRKQGMGFYSYASISSLGLVGDAGTINRIHGEKEPLSGECATALWYWHIAARRGWCKRARNGVCGVVLGRSGLG